MDRLSHPFLPLKKRKVKILPKRIIQDVLEFVDAVNQKEIVKYVNYATLVLTVMCKKVDRQPYNLPVVPKLNMKKLEQYIKETPIKAPPLRNRNPPKPYALIQQNINRNLVKYCIDQTLNLKISS